MRVALKTYAALLLGPGALVGLWSNPAHADWRDDIGTFA